MIFEQIPSGGDRNFGYLIACDCSRQAAVVDPSPNPEPCFKQAAELGVVIKYIINTHTHHDHTGGNNFYQEKDIPLVTHTSAQIGDIRVGDNDIVKLGHHIVRFIHTPGHTPESMCVFAESHLVTGDTLFVGKVGGTYSRKDAETEFNSLKKLMSLPPEVRVWPGHNYGLRPTSTIGEELESNPFIQRLNSFEDFIWLKDNWADYKKEHNIA